MVAIAVASMAGALGLPGASAQPASDAYEAPVSGAVIEAVSPWALDPDLTSSGGDYDIVGLRATFDRLLISFLPATVDSAFAQATVLEEFASGFDGYQEIDRGAYGAVTYSLDIANVDGLEFGVFSLFLNAPDAGFVEFSMYMGPAAAFADGLAVVQQSVTIDGAAVFDGVEGDGLQTLLDDHAGIAGGSGPVAQRGDDPTAEPSEEPTAPSDGDAEPATVTAPDESDTSDDRDSRKLPEVVESTPDAGNESETGRGDRKLPTGDDLSDFEELGLIDQGEYVSPQFDTDVLWDETWSFDPEISDPIVSDTDAVTDSLTLVWNGDDFILLYVDLYEADGFTPADYEELWASDAYLAETADPDAEVLLQDSNRSTGSVLIRDYLSDGEEILLLRQAISLDRGDTIAVVTLIGLPDSFADAYADAGDGVTIDGEPALDVFTPREIERAR